MKKLNVIAVFSLVSASMAFGAVPKRGRVTDDTMIYQNLSEIKVQKEKDLNFDSDVARLASIESRYGERLPSITQNPRIQGPAKRIHQQKRPRQLGGRVAR